MPLAHAKLGTDEQVYNYAENNIIKALELQGLQLVPDSISIRGSKHFFNLILKISEINRKGETDVYYVNFSAEDTNGEIFSGNVYLLAENMEADMPSQTRAILVDPRTEEEFSIQFIGINSVPYSYEEVNLHLR